jgi:cation diffusion facilitator family transporter
MEKIDTSPRVRQITWAGIWVNLVLSIVKILAGVFGMSKALIADGIESGADIITSLVLVAGSKFWNAPPDVNHPYGHRRIETIITFGIGLVVGVVGVSIIVNSIGSLRTGTNSQPTLLALVVAIISVLSKEALFQWSVREGRKIKSMAVVANAWHHRSDAISSIPVVFAVGFAQFFPQWTFLDAVGALVAAGFILKASIDIIMPALREIADTGASAETVEKISAIAQSVEGVRSIHALRTRLVGSNIHVDLHIVVDPDITVMAGHLIGDKVTDTLKDQEPEVLDVLVHIDPSPDM